MIFDKTIPHSFRAALARDGQAPALITPEGRWTYSDLARAIRVVQRHLRQQRLEPQSIVGILLEDPRWQVAALLASLQKRLVTVVVDGSLPESRMRYILEDSGARALLTDGPNQPRAEGVAPGGVRLEVLDLSVSRLPMDDADAGASSDELALGEADDGASPDDLACLFYTSGSTGEPKGVMHTHRTILHEVRVHTRTLEITASDRFSMLYPLHAIGSNRDVFAALLNGAVLCPFPFQRRGFGALKDWLRDQGVTILHAIPLIYRELVAAFGDDGVQEDARVVFVAGDRVLPSDVAAQRRYFPMARFYTGIGSSEATSLYTHWFVDPAYSLDISSLPTGAAVPEKDVFLVDAERRPVAGEGEIAVRSRFLSPGYFRRPSQTSAVFGSDPETGERTL